MSAVALYWVFLRAVLLSFSGFATVPALRETLVVHEHLLSDAQLSDAIAMGQASPGPIGSYVVIIGYFVAGISGAAAGALALATPAALAVPIARLVMRGHSAVLQGATSGIVVAACALMIVTGLQLAPEAAPSAPYLAILVGGTVLLAVTDVTPLWIIAIGAGIGLVVR